LSKLPNRAYFSPGNDCLNAILESINSATHSLKVCVFTISDDRISEALVNAFEKGITVKILTDNEKLFDKGSDIRMLATVGIPLRVDITQNHMHHKFAIIDNEAILTGSYNWTRSAANYNHENVLITHDRDTVLAYCQQFDLLWHEMKELDA
jgi:mitochondrial cardiolipin hydrolase